MTYALIANGVVSKYPYTFAQLRKDNPNISFPHEPVELLLAEHGVVKVHSSERPAHDPITQNVVESTPVFTNGKWVEGWSVVDATPEEISGRQYEADHVASHAEVKADNFVSNFISMTPAQVANYVENNTANLAATRALLKKMVVMLLILAKREFR